jgi:hypothetical protein
VIILELYCRGWNHAAMIRIIIGDADDELEQRLKARGWMSD